MAKPLAGKLALSFAAALALAFGLCQQAAALEPANGFEVELEANGTFSRDGHYEFDEGEFSETRTVTTDGSYSVDGALLKPVYFPTGGTDKRTYNLMVDPARSSFAGTVSGTGKMSNSYGDSEDAQCAAPYISHEAVFPLAYRGIAGGGFQMFVAPSADANRDSTAIDCVGSDYSQTLWFETQARFGGGPELVDPAFAAWQTVTVTQSQLAQKSFSVPVSFSSQDSQSWAQGAKPPHGYCDNSVPASYSGSCFWAHDWSGKLTFTRVCSPAEGGAVEFVSPQSGSDGVTRWLPAGSCGGGDGGDGAAACVVPEVEGKKLKQAKRKIEKADCSVGKISKKASKKVDKGRVIKQRPKPGVRKPAGSAVKLTVSKGRKD